MSHPANTPEPPYFAVIFTSVRTDVEATAYGATAERMEELARTIPGYLGIESARNSNGEGITVSYWENEAAIALWRNHLEHQAAQRQGKMRWYHDYRVRIARVERDYAGPEGRL